MFSPEPKIAQSIELGRSFSQEPRTLAESELKYQLILYFAFLYVWPNVSPRRPSLPHCGFRKAEWASVTLGWAVSRLVHLGSEGRLTASSHLRLRFQDVRRNPDQGSVRVLESPSVQAGWRSRGRGLPAWGSSLPAARGGGKQGEEDSAGEDSVGEEDSVEWQPWA